MGLFWKRSSISLNSLSSGSIVCLTASGGSRGAVPDTKLIEVPKCMRWPKPWARRLFGGGTVASSAPLRCGLRRVNPERLGRKLDGRSEAKKAGGGIETEKRSSAGSAATFGSVCGCSHGRERAEINVGLEMYWKSARPEKRMLCTT
eukprot:scaffold247053_cov24-Tisochrysis_lutea.AAC.3